MRAFLGRQALVGFFFILISLSKVNTKEENLELNNSKQFYTNEKEAIKYTLNVPDNSRNKYVKIEVKRRNININYILSLYLDNSRTNRVQLAQSLNGNAKLYVTKNQNKNGQLYIDLECSGNCEGDIESKSYEKIELLEGETLRYYVNDENEEMEFSLIPNSTSQISNIWARGQMKIQTTLNVNNKIQKDNYYIVNGAMERADFKVYGKRGDVINVGYFGYSKQKIKNEIYYNSNTKMIVNGDIVTGFLQKGSLEKICYGMQMKNTPLIEEAIFGTGVILTRIAYSYVMNKDGNRNTTSNDEIFSSSSLTSSMSSLEINDQKICFTFPPVDKFPQFSNVKDIVFVYQLTSELNKINTMNLYEPQLMGLFYPRIIQKGEKVVFIPQYGDGDFEKMTMSLFSLNGFPKMTVIKCDTYPLCSLKDDSLKKVASPRNINRFSSYSFKKNNEYGAYSSISKKQTLFVVECKESEKNHAKESKYFDIMCSFGSLIYKNKDEIQLIEDHYYNQYALKDQINNYKIKIKNESKIKKIFIDVITCIGDVEMTPISQEGTSYSQYISINKIYTSIKADKPSETLQDIVFSVKALTNTYYTLLFNFGREEVERDSLITNELQTGLSYLVTIDIEKMDDFEIGNKIIKIANERYFDFVPLMVNFFSLNCEINVGFLYNDPQGNPIYSNNLKKFGNFYHDVVNPSEDRYYSSQIEYRINVTQSEHSDYKGKLCKIYASAIEVSTAHEYNSRDILIPDNTPQQVMFGKNITHVSYGYVHVDFEHDLLIKFDPQHVAQYNVRIYYEGIERVKNETIAANDILYINHEEWANICNETLKVCYIQVDISLKRTRDVDPILEFSIKSVASNFVSYIPKNILKIDYIQNEKPQYYYTELGQNEIGFVVANFLRGSGKVLGKIVRKNITEEGANWRGKYRLPKDNELFEMDEYTKKMDIATYELDCEKGCYLLLKVVSDVEGHSVPINRNYPYSIMINSHSINGNYDKVPIISVPLDEYIIGTVEPSDTPNRMFQFYSVWLNLEAEQVIIDLQSDAGGLFINVGNVRPTTGNAHFKLYPQGKDTLHYISKNEILSKVEGLKNIRNCILTIGVWTNLTDTVYTTPFAFIVRLGNNSINDIYRVNSDQKALCKTKNAGGFFRCLYVIEYDYISDFNNLFIYTSVQTKSAFFHLYANYINLIDYEMGDFEKIKELIPTKGKSRFSSTELNADYLYIVDGLPENKYLLVSAETNVETTIELMSTFCTFQNGVTPNPTTPQLFMAMANYTFSLNFPKNNMVMVYLRGIAGSAEIHWSNSPNNKYYLKGRDDRLSISSEKSGEEHKLLITATSNILDGNGFVFYVNYNIRMDYLNFDALVLDKSVNYVFTESDFPIIYYTPVNLTNMGNNDYYEVFFSFNILENEKEKNLTYYENIPFDIKGYIIDERTIYEAKLTPDLTIEKTNRIDGLYDQALRTGLIRISKNDIQNAKIPSHEKPYLYLKIDKSDDFKDIRKYKRIGVETTVFQSSSKVSVSELSYQFGNVDENEQKRELILRPNANYKLMYIQFSCLNDALSIKINGIDLKKENENYGKAIYSFNTLGIKNSSLTLEIYKNNNNNKNKEFFMFQYTNVNGTNYQYSIKDTKIKVTRKFLKNGLANYAIKLSPIDNYKNYDNVTYIVRSIYGKNAKIPKKADLSIKIDQQNVKEFYEPHVGSDGKLELKIDNITDNVSYFQVIAQIKNKEDIQYLSYDISTLSKKRTPLGKGLVVALVIGILLLIIVIILIVVIIIFNNKNKDLLQKVNQVSFADDTREGKEDNLLIGNDGIN